MVQNLPGQNERLPVILNSNTHPLIAGLRFPILSPVGNFWAWTLKFANDSSVNGLPFNWVIKNKRRLYWIKVLKKVNLKR
jgi:hypothetical protein